MQTRGSADIIFVDISAYQTITDETLLFSKTPAIYLRAFGSDHSAPDATFNERVALARSYNVPSGAYYFATPTTPIETDPAECDAQCDQFIAALETAYGAGKYGDLVPMLDVEAWGTTTPQAPMFYMSGLQVLSWIERFRDRFYTKTKRRLGFYSNRFFLIDTTQLGLTTADLERIADMPLWLAEYDQYYPENTTDTGAPANLGGWETYAAWQYAEGVEADQWGVSHYENKIDLNRTTSLDLIMPPAAPTNIQGRMIADNLIEVTFEYDTPPTDYIGSSLYVNGAWKKWILPDARRVEWDVTGYTDNTNITVQIVAEDGNTDFGFSEIKSIFLYPTLTEAQAAEPALYPKLNKEAGTLPKRTTGITSKSLSSFIVDAGAVYLNYGETDERLLGATRGGSTFTVEAEMREMEIDGVRQAVKGTKRVISVVASMTVNLLELTAENLALALTGSELTTFTPEGGTTPTHDIIRRVREIGTMDYVKNVAMIGKVNNTTENFVGILYNALSSGGLEIALEDENEAAIELTFTAHIDADSIADDGTYQEAWEIRMPITPAT